MLRTHLARLNQAKRILLLSCERILEYISGNRRWLENPSEIDARKLKQKDVSVKLKAVENHQYPKKQSVFLLLSYASHRNQQEA